MSDVVLKDVRKLYAFGRIKFFIPKNSSDVNPSDNSEWRREEAETKKDGLEKVHENCALQRATRIQSAQTSTL